MKILKIIHGYPPRYNAGSEVYSQMLCLGLAQKHEVQVFSRFEDPFTPDYAVIKENDYLDERIKLNLINLPLERNRYRLSSEQVDDALESLLKKEKPDVVHIGHLNHLSVTLVDRVKQLDIPILYTLHDYWLMCPRGQFLQRNPLDPAEMWALCDGQENRKCAERCYSGYGIGCADSIEKDTSYWNDWTARRMKLIKDMTHKVDMFHAPANYLKNRYVKEFGLSEKKICYLDYGFVRERSEGRKRNNNEKFTFGYIGTHIPAKGIQHLLSAFGELSENCQLRIWGRPRPQNTSSLMSIVSTLPESVQQRIHWLPEYRNEHLVKDVFNHVDCIVVPSIWVENSPLVIHEAQQARVPVITADAGGMAEYVHHEVNGLLFKHRDYISLAQEMQRFVDDIEFAKRLGEKGYLYSEDGQIPSIENHVEAIEKIYSDILGRGVSC